VWDYPRPPRLQPDARHVTVKVGEMMVADSRLAVRVLETASPPTFYLPPKDVNHEVLIRASGGSICEWKGAATYWSVQVGGRLIERAGWSYEAATGAFAKLAGYLSFYPAHIACFVEDERVQPQSGGFYGGWVTKEIVGPFKGTPGTQWW
jgi:uncharacterized protein (DUF427 family)